MVTLDAAMKNICLTTKQWYTLCDALETAPDNPVDDVIHKAELLNKALKDERRAHIANLPLGPGRGRKVNQ